MISILQLICEAILHSKDNQLTLSEIYSEIHRRHPYYLLENRNWQVWPSTQFPFGWLFTAVRWERQETMIQNKDNIGRQLFC